MIHRPRQSGVVIVLALAILATTTGAAQPENTGAPLLWGFAALGHLGDAPPTVRLAPVPVVGPTDLRSVSGGFRHTVARRIDGTVWAWGDNDSGQLGVGPLPSMTSTPLQVTALSGVLSVSAGYNHNLALRSDGTVLAWGWNSSGQLGDGTTADRFTPLQVTGLTGVVAVSAGVQHSLAVTANGTVWAWGSNDRGQLGDGSTTDRAAPAPVAALPAAIGVAAGAHHSLALATDGTVWAWGDNDNGQLGDGTTTDRPTPVQAPGLTGVTAIASGYYHSVALKADGTVWAWGRNSPGGMVGNGSNQNQLLPVQVVGLAGITALESGGFHTLVRGSNGSVWAWGRSGQGQCGRTYDYSQPLAADVPGIASAIAIGGGNSVSFAVLSDGTTVTWGVAAGAAGDGLRMYADTPEPVPGAPPVRSLEFGGGYTLAIAADGSLWSWGSNQSGELGLGGFGVFTLGPTQVPGLANVAAAAAGPSHALAVDGEGNLWAWGANNNGQLGDDTRPDTSPSPAPVPALADVVAAGAGWDASFAVRANGSLWSWGFNQDGTLGDGTTTTRSTPAQVAGLPPIRSVATQIYARHTLALANDGTVWAWGRNASGELGDGTTTNRLTPALVPGLAGIVGIAVTTWETSYALDSSGHVWSWGDSRHGQLGDGSTDDRLFPAIIPGLENVVEIVTGDTHAIARTASGRVFVWGRNYGGMLGLGDTEDRWYPTELPGVTGVLHVFAGTDLSGLIAACELACAADVPAAGAPGEPVGFSSSFTATSGCMAPPSFDWNFGDGSAHSAAQSPSRAYAGEGSFHWVLTVSANGESCIREGDITVSYPCTLACSASVPAFVQVDDPAAFVGSATPSHCPAAATFDWDFGDGSAHATVQSPSHAYTTAGPYQWTLTATADGITCSRSGSITVLGASCSGDYDLIIPAAAHSNNQWQSDVDLLNVGAAGASVDIALLKAGQPNLDPDAMNVVVAPGRTVRIPDILGTLLPASNAALGVRFCAGTALVDSRFYNIANPVKGTYGMLVPALAPSQAITPSTIGWFHHITYSPDPRSGYRVNIGFANASPFSVNAVIRLYGDSGELLGTKPFSLSAYRHLQYTEIHKIMGTGPVDHGAASVEVTTPNARLHAYVMLIDNISQDPVLFTAELQQH